MTIPSGLHTIRLAVDWCGSDELTFDAQPGDHIVFEGGNSGGGALTLLFRPGKYLWLRRVS